MIHLPKQGYFKRMRIYLTEMYPMPVRLLTAGLLYISFVAFLERIHGVESKLFSAHTLIGIWSIFAILLILRLMDELKDREIDRQLFSDRPLPSGKVLESDIGFSLIIVIVLYLIPNTMVDKGFWMALFILKYSFLMFKYFFIPRILRRYLLLNLATHNPIIPIILFYLVILFSVQHQLSLSDLKWDSIVLLMLMYWSMSLAWEIARKIRSREEENEYVTYSQIFGRIKAVLVAGGTQTIAFIIGIHFYKALSFSEIFGVILLLGYGMTMWGHIRFVFRPNPKTSKLKPFAEWYIVTVLAARIIEFALFF